jgi:hypothetical protein
MRKASAIARVLRKLAPLMAAVVLLASGGAHAQLGTLNGGTTSPNPGMLGASPPVGSSGIPFGAVELGTGGLSPAPFAPSFPSSTFSGPSIPSNTGIGVGAVGGSTLGSGLSPTLAPPGFPALAPTGTGAGPRSPTITNYGFGGMQTPPGSPRNGRGR